MRLQALGHPLKESPANSLTANLVEKKSWPAPCDGAMAGFHQYLRGHIWVQSGAPANALEAKEIIAVNNRLST
jgi:hypothetical protein